MGEDNGEEEDKQSDAPSKSVSSMMGLSAPASLGQSARLKDVEDSPPLKAFKAGVVYQEFDGPSDVHHTGMGLLVESQGDERGNTDEKTGPF